MRILFFSLVFLHLSFAPLVANTTRSLVLRSFDAIFPGLSPAAREAAFTTEGYYISYARVPNSGIIGSSQSVIDPHIINNVLSKQPGFLIESILLIPGEEGRYSLLDVYNALQNTRGLQGRLYHSHTRSQEIPLFEEVTRIESERRNVAINDPPRAANIPLNETIFMRLKDANFGNSFYRGDMVLEQYGLRYSLTNNRNLTYLFLPVIREGRFTALLYFEPIREGVLIYGLAGADVSDFISSRIDIPSAIGKRLEVIISWVSDGVTGN